MTTSDVTTAIVVDQTTNEVFLLSTILRIGGREKLKAIQKKITMSLPIGIKNCIFQSKK